MGCKSPRAKTAHGALGAPDAGGEGFNGAEAEDFVEADSVGVGGGDGEREGVEVASAKSVDGSLH